MDHSIGTKSPGLMVITTGTAHANKVLWNVEGCAVLAFSVVPQEPSSCMLLFSAVKSADQNVSVEQKSLQKVSGF